MVGAVAERQDVARAPPHVEVRGVGSVLALVAVCRPVEQQYPAAGRDGGVADGDVAGGDAGQTLYRYFENREVLRNAYVHRETYRLYDAIKEQISGIADPRQRLSAGIATTLRLVRESPALASWFATTQPPIGGELAEQSDVITALAAAFVNSLGADDPPIVESRGRWLVRVITSLLIFPGRDVADEQAMVEEFVVPIVLPVEQKAGQANGCR